MTLDQEIEYWERQEKAAKSKEAAIEGMDVPADIPDGIDDEAYRTECDKIAERIRRTIQPR